jgi:hypothetical protein
MMYVVSDQGNAINSLSSDAAQRAPNCLINQGFVEFITVLRIKTEGGHKRKY